MNETQIEWNKTALQMLIDDVEMSVNFACMMAGVVVEQQKKIAEFQQHFWEIL